jgi:hypothetical protein
MKPYEAWSFSQYLSLERRAPRVPLFYGQGTNRWLDRAQLPEILILLGHVSRRYGRGRDRGNGRRFVDDLVLEVARML